MGRRFVIQMTATYLVRIIVLGVLAAPACSREQTPSPTSRPLGTAPAAFDPALTETADGRRADNYTESSNTDRLLNSAATSENDSENAEPSLDMPQVAVLRARAGAAGVKEFYIIVGNGDDPLFAEVDRVILWNRAAARTYGSIDAVRETMKAATVEPSVNWKDPFGEMFKSVRIPGGFVESTLYEIWHPKYVRPGRGRGRDQALIYERWMGNVVGRTTVTAPSIRDTIAPADDDLGRGLNVALGFHGHVWGKHHSAIAELEGATLSPSVSGLMRGFFSPAYPLWFSPIRTGPRSEGGMNMGYTAGAYLYFESNTGGLTAGQYSIPVLATDACLAFWSGVRDGLSQSYKGLSLSGSGIGWDAPRSQGGSYCHDYGSRGQEQLWVTTFRNAATGFDEITMRMAVDPCGLESAKPEQLCIEVLVMEGPSRATKIQK